MRKFTVVGPAARLLFLASLAGCWNPPRIVSARDPEFNGRITRLLVLVADDGSNDAELDSDRVGRSVEGPSHRPPCRRGLGEGQIQGSATTDVFVPDATLRIAPNVTIRSEAGERDEVYVDASLYLPGDTSHRIWRAKVIHSASSANADAAGTPRWATLFAKRVVDQLFLDGVLR